MKRSNIVLAVLLVVQLAIVVWVFRPVQSGSAPVGQLVKDVTENTVTAIKVLDNTSQVSLAKVDGKWVAPDAGNYPVETASVSKFISDVVSIDTSRLVATTPTSHGRLKVAASDFVRRVELQTADGKQHVLFVGSSPNVNTAHVRLDGQDAVYLTSGSISSDARSDLPGWVNTAYVQYIPDSLTGLTVHNAAGTYAFKKGADGAWTLPGLAAGETLTQSFVTGLVNQLSSVNLLKPLGKDAKPEYGLDKPQATATLDISPTAGAPTTVTLAIGALDDAAGAYTVKASTSDYYVTAAKFALQGAVNATRDQFVAAPPPPAASAPLTGTASISGTPSFTDIAPISAITPPTATAPVTHTPPATATTPVTGTAIVTP